MADEPFIPPKTNKIISQTPSLPKEPTKEILAKEFKMDESLLSGGEPKVEILDTNKSTPNNNEPAKVDEKAGQSAEKVGESNIVHLEQPPKKEEKKEEVKSVLKPPAEKKDTKEIVQEKSEKKEVIKQIAPPSKEARDYSGFSSEEAGLLKQMSNEAFTYTSKLIKENKDLAKGKDSTFLQHPEAYTLTPEYRQLQTEIYMHNTEAQCWENALLQCKAGQKFKPISGFDPNTGQPVFGAEMDPSDKNEEILRQNVMIARNGAQQKQGQLTEKSKGFQGRIRSDLEAIESERKQRFAWVSDPKLLDYTLNIEGIGDLPIKQIRQDLINLFPPYYRNSPGVEVAADLIVALRIQHAELAEARNGKQVAETKKEEALRGEPSSEEKPLKEPDAINGVKNFSLAGMPT